MILSYRDLVATWKKKQLRFDPDISESQIGLSSIDLRLGHVFARLKPSPGIVVRPARGFDPTDHVEIEDASKGGFLSGGPIFRLPPGEFRLAFTLEEVTLPPGLAANVQGKSSLARAGLAVHITAPHIHPAWSGRITLELYNHGPWPLEFVPGEDLVCQLILYKVTSPVDTRVARALSTYVRQATPYPRRRPEGGAPKRRRGYEALISAVDWLPMVLAKVVPSWCQRWTIHPAPSGRVVMRKGRLFARLGVLDPGEFALERDS